MTSIRREISINASAEHVWSAVRDVGALHTRLVPGFVIDTKLEDGARMVTFGNGTVVRELIVDVDDDARRIAWAAVGTSMTHHSASLQVFAEDGRTRAVWIADLLPHELAAQIAGMIQQGLSVMKQTLEGSVGRQ